MINYFSVVFGILTAAATLWSAAFLSGRFSPNIELVVRPIWSANNKGLLRLIIELENRGFIRVGIEKVLLVVNEQKICLPENNQLCLGKEWIDFSDADQIMKTSYYINPKEAIHIEQLYSVDENAILHVGLQIYLKFPWYIKKLGAQARSTRQTRTYYLSSGFDDKSCCNCLSFKGEYQNGT